MIFAVFEGITRKEKEKRRRFEDEEEEVEKRKRGETNQSGGHWLPKKGTTQASPRVT